MGTSKIEYIWAIYQEGIILRRVTSKVKAKNREALKYRSFQDMTDGGSHSAPSWPPRCQAEHEVEVLMDADYDGLLYEVEEGETTRKTTSIGEDKDPPIKQQ